MKSRPIALRVAVALGVALLSACGGGDGDGDGNGDGGAGSAGDGARVSDDGAKGGGTGPGGSITNGRGGASGESSAASAGGDPGGADGGGSSETGGVTDGDGGSSPHCEGPDPDNSPDGEEVCDGADNDCDGTADNEVSDDGTDCDTGLDGICSAGTTICSDGELTCQADTNPSNELCDGLDNDCDGVVDNNVTDDGDACDTGLDGVCTAGTTICTDSQLSCQASSEPSDELCDGLDNDCDGVVDNNVTDDGDDCDTGLDGVCTAGITICTDSQLSCQASSEPSDELCDGLDNDCDGVVDNNVTDDGDACNTGLDGVCTAGITICTDSQLSCQASSEPSDELCDGLDNDCDGTADNDVTDDGADCTTGQPGVCAAGLTVCADGELSCGAASEPSNELCDGLDNDCNGEIDDDVADEAADCATTQPGVCAAGLTVCVDGELACQATAEASNELCDGLDNDCNGEVDDNIIGEVDTDGDGAPSCHDCDDGDPNNWESCATCVDRDGDTFYTGCDAYDSVGGPDCDDADPLTTECPRNIILMVMDGCGFEQLRATRMFANGDTAPLFLETLPESGEVITVNATGQWTDSAAASSAMATGRKYSNGAISYANGQDVTTVLEIHQAAGKSTGLVTTYTPVIDATPAGFGAHESSRANYAAIANDLMTGSRPNVLMGRTDNNISATDFEAAGYRVVTDAAGLAAEVDASADHILGLFADDSPSLSVRAEEALTRLSEDSDGFFLLIETEGTDEAGHANNLGKVITAALEFDDAVQTVVEWAIDQGDTRVVVLADHETGGLNVTETTPTAGEIPAADFTNTGHTTRQVPIYVYGASLPADVIDNTKVFELLGGTTTAAIGPAELAVFEQDVDSYTDTVDTWLQQSSPDTGHATDALLEVDGDDPATSNQANQTLLLFDKIFGSDAGQIPLTATIVSATLVLQVSNAGDGVAVHEMLADWSASATWNSFGSGLELGVDAASAALVTTGAAAVGTLSIVVTSSVAAWLSDPATNFGWAILPTGTDGVAFDSAQGTRPPRLVVEYQL